MLMSKQTLPFRVSAQGGNADSAGFWRSDFPEDKLQFPEQLRVS